ncbi:MAG: hypothetical protein LT102_07000 [Burkholderiaceae bacterium]|nr:hypothetical protein [Burkholderiaceae bacterium]
MKTGSFLAVFGVVGFLFGVGFLFVPEVLLPLYGSSAVEAGPLNPHAVLNVRYFGSVLLGFALINWFARATHDREALRAILLGNLVGDVLGLLVTFQGLLSGAMGTNVFSWSTVLIYALFAAASLYLLVSDTREVTHG